jgi:hypothetical protein
VVRPHPAKQIIELQKKVAALLGEVEDSEV